MKTILVTGGATGIGKIITENLLHFGYNVIIINRTKKNLIKAEKELSNLPGKLYCFCGDLSDNNFINNLRQEIKKIAPIFALIHCAGIQGEISSFSESDLSRWWKGFEINTLSLLNTLKLVLPGMKKRKAGKIITFSGGGATFARENFSSYASSKIAIVKLTEILAEELKGYNITANSLAPGPFDTRMIDEIIKKGTKAGEKEVRLAKGIKKSGGTKAKLLNDIINFLLSDESDGISGKLLSAVWDDWRNPRFRKKLKTEKDFGTLRRIDNRNFLNKK